MKDAHGAVTVLVQRLCVWLQRNKNVDDSYNCYAPKGKTADIQMDSWRSTTLMDGHNDKEYR